MIPPRWFLPAGFVLYKKDRGVYRWNGEKSLQYKRGHLQRRKDQNTIINAVREGTWEAQRRTKRTKGGGTEREKAEKWMNIKIVLKNLSKSVDKSAGVWYYTWAPSAGQKNDFYSPAGSLWKEPIDAEKHQLTLRGLKRSKFKKVQKLLKKDLTKNHFGGKINRSPVERLRRTGPWKLNNIEKLVTEPLCVWKNT